MPTQRQFADHGPRWDHVKTHVNVRDIHQREGGFGMASPNLALTRLIEEAGISFAGLARRINELGAAQQGAALRYDYTAVHRWTRRGETPKPAVRSLIATVLTEHLGRRITPSDFGMVEESSLASRALDYPSEALDTVDTITELGRADVNRRGLIAAPFVLAALAASSRDWLLATLDETVNTDGIGKVDLRQVAAVREMFTLFQEMDVMRGGGHARIALVEYLNSYVLPLVKQTHEPNVQLALYEAASEQAYLVGWMAYDDGQHGLAQRYLIQSLRLAQASGNGTLGAHVLAGMSDQANLLGHPHEALMLARSGQRGVDLSRSQACLADLYILEARALGALGRRTEASQAVAKAEATFSKVNSANEPEWARFIDPAYIFGEAAQCFRDLGIPSDIDRFATESINEAQKQRRARRSALSHAALADGLLRRSEPEAAAATALQVVALTTSVNSSRCRQAVAQLGAALRPHAELHAVKEFAFAAKTELGITI